jgi:UDP-N-acetyl-D-mannosaminuronic acid dehydrogenase
LNRFDEVFSSIKSKSAVVAVVGLGYIGLPTALFYARAGFKVRGIDNNRNLVRELNKGRTPTHEDGLSTLAKRYLANISINDSYDVVKGSGIFVLCLPSPIDESQRPIIKYLENAIRSIAEVVEEGGLFLVESTVPVGTTIRLSSLFKEVTGMTPDEDFWFSHCPERVMPGRIIDEMKSNHRLAGGVTEKASRLAEEFLSSVFGADLVHSTTASISEAAKLAENAFRDVNIAYANELAKICAALSIDVSEVIRLANFHPRVQILKPGLGVGGYCLPKDGWILATSASGSGMKPDLIPAARQVNDSMPKYVSKRIRREVLETGERSPVGLLGLAFKENISDTRNSPTVDLLDLLLSTDIEVIVYDPLIGKYPGAQLATSIENLIEASSILVLCVGHKSIIDDLARADLERITLFDPRNLVPAMRTKVKKYVGLSD